MTAQNFLDAASSTLGDRAAEYDSQDGERSMAAAVAMFNAGRGQDAGPLTEMDGWQFIVCLKMVRQWTNQRAGKFHRDSAVDQTAYSALAAEAGKKSFPASVDTMASQT